jgi:hypothetical protein
MDDSGPSRTVSLPSLPVINSLLQKREVSALIDRFPHIKQRLDVLVSAAELSDVPSARPEILNLLGLSHVDISVGVFLCDLLVASSRWCQRTLLSLLETLTIADSSAGLAASFRQYVVFAPSSDRVADLFALAGLVRLLAGIVAI